MPPSNKYDKKKKENQKEGDNGSKSGPLICCVPAGKHRILISPRYFIRTFKVKVNMFDTYLIIGKLGIYTTARQQKVLRAPHTDVVISCIYVILMIYSFYCLGQSKWFLWPLVYQDLNKSLSHPERAHAYYPIPIGVVTAADPHAHRVRHPRHKILDIERPE